MHGPLWRHQPDAHAGPALVPGMSGLGYSDTDTMKDNKTTPQLQCSPVFSAWPAPSTLANILLSNLEHGTLQAEKAG